MVTKPPTTLGLGTSAPAMHMATNCNAYHLRHAQSRASEQQAGSPDLQVFGPLGPSSEPEPDAPGADLGHAASPSARVSDWACQHGSTIDHACF